MTTFSVLKVNCHYKMECTCCHNILEISKFSYKNEAQKIYYLHCNQCREKIATDPYKKKREKAQYERMKKTSTIHCKCGVSYVAFRDYHILRHLNSQKHLHFIHKEYTEDETTTI